MVAVYWAKNVAPAFSTTTLRASLPHFTGTGTEVLARPHSPPAGLRPGTPGAVKTSRRGRRRAGGCSLGRAGSQRRRDSPQRPARTTGVLGAETGWGEPTPPAPTAACFGPDFLPGTTAGPSRPASCFGPPTGLPWLGHSAVPLKGLPSLSEPLDPSACWARPRDRLPRPFPAFCSQHFWKNPRPPPLPENTRTPGTLGFGPQPDCPFSFVPQSLTVLHSPAQPSLPPRSLQTRRGTGAVPATGARLLRPDHPRPRAVRLRPPPRPVSGRERASVKGCPVEGPQPFNMLVRTLPWLQALPLLGVLSSEQHSSPVVATGEPRRILAMPGAGAPYSPLRGLLTQLCRPLTRHRNNGPAFSCKLRVPDGDQPHVLKEMRNKRPDGAGLGGHRAASRGQGRPGLSLPRSVIRGWGRKSTVSPMASGQHVAAGRAAPGPRWLQRLSHLRT